MSLALVSGGSSASSGPPAPADIVYVGGSAQKICQLTGEMDRELHQPTVNRTAAQFGLAAIDLGYSFEHNGKLFFLFGDGEPTAPFGTRTPRSS